MSPAGTSLRALALRLRVDPGHLDLPGALENRQGVEHGARRLAPGVPGHQHLFADALVAPGVGDDQHRPATLDSKPVRNIEALRPRPIRVGLAGDHQVGCARIFKHDVRHAKGLSLILAPFRDEAPFARGVFERRLHRRVLGAIELAMGIDDDRRAHRRPRREDCDRRDDRQPDKMCLEGLGQAHCRRQQRGDAARIIAVHQDGLVRHGQPHDETRKLPVSTVPHKGPP